MNRRVAIVSIRPSGGGNELAASALVEVLRQAPDFDVYPLLLRDRVSEAGWLTRRVFEALARRSINLLWFAAPLFLRQDRPDIAILQHGNANFILPFLQWCGIRTILVCDSPVRSRSFLRHVLEAARWRFLRYADHVVNTFPFRSEWSDTVIAIPLRRLPPFPSRFGAGPINTLVYVGRLEPEKGIHGFLNLARELPNYRFSIFGSGRLEPIVRSAAARSPNIKYSGFIDHWTDELDQGACVLGCSPVEASWTTGAEALLAGVPVIALSSETGGPQAYAAVSDKVVIVEALTKDAIGDAIMHLNARLSANNEANQELYRRLDAATIRAAYSALITQPATRNGQADSSRSRSKSMRPANF